MSVRVTRGPEALREQLRKADSCARFVLKEGTCAALVCATTDLDEKAIVENAVAACDGLVSCVPKKWRNVQSVVLKLPDSASLPVFTGALEPIKRKAPSDDAPAKTKKARVAEPVVKKGRKSLKAKLREMK